VIHQQVLAGYEKALGPEDKTIPRLDTVNTTWAISRPINYGWHCAKVMMVYCIGAKILLSSFETVWPVSISISVPMRDINPFSACSPPVISTACALKRQ